MSRLFIIIIFLLSFNNIKAKQLDHYSQQTFNLQALSIEDGLSQSVVNAIIQDKEGYIWLATEDGLNRFDGYEFKKFYHSHKDVTALNENLIYSLHESLDKKGIWIGTNQGLSYYDKALGHFTNFNDKYNLPHSTVTAIVQVDDEQLFIGSDNGLNVYNLKEEKFSAFKSEDNLTLTDEIYSFHLADNNLWIASSDCFYQLNTTNHSLINFCEKLAWNKQIFLQLK